MSTSVERMVQYCAGVANEFTARLNRIRAFVPDEYLTSGTANEMILRNFLSRLSAGRYEVGQGFVCSPTDPSLVSRQCDILVYDHSYPVVYSEGEIKIVFPQSVRMLIEAKTRLTRRELYHALDNIRVVRQMDETINGVVFAFRSPRRDTVLRDLQEYDGCPTMRHAPMAILLLNRGTIIHRWSGSETDSAEAPYEVRITRNRRGATVIAFLLLLYFDAQMLGVWGGSSITKMMHDMLEEETEKIAEGIRLGRQ